MRRHLRQELTGSEGISGLFMLDRQTDRRSMDPRRRELGAAEGSGRSN